MTGAAAPRRIGISLGLLDKLDDGFGEFSLQLGRRIAAAAPAWRERDGIAIDFHLRSQLEGLFGSAVGYLPAVEAHERHHEQRAPYALWHTLQHMSRLLPPAGCGHRLLTVHDLNYVYGSSFVSRWRYRRRALQLLARTDRVVAISRHTATDLQRHLGWRGPLDVIHNGARKLVGAAQSPLPLGHGRPFLFHLSRMTPNKNPAALLALATAWPAMDFLLCGPPLREAQALAAANRLPNLQVHLGISDAQKAWAYAHCAGFLFPSLAEGFGLPPIEAMHFGKPVFLARRSCLPEIGGEAAYYFDDFAPAAMRAVVERGLSEGATPARVSAVQAHAAQFDWDRCAEQYLALYRAQLALPP